MSALIKVHCSFRVIFTEKMRCDHTCKLRNEVRSHMYALAHTSAKPCYLSLEKTVIYLSLYITNIIDTKIRPQPCRKAPTMQKGPNHAERSQPCRKAPTMQKGPNHAERPLPCRKAPTMQKAR